MAPEKPLPRMPFRFADREYVIALRPDRQTWAIDVNGAWYSLGKRDPATTSARFALDRLRNAGPTFPPGLLASRYFSLLLSIDGRELRAWPAFLPRAAGVATYINPATGDRVAAVYDHPVWMFSTPGREPSACGTTSIEQTVVDVADLGRIWLRSQEED